MKRSPSAALALLPLLASAWTAVPSSNKLSERFELKSTPTLLQPTEEAAFGVANTEKLSKLYDLVVIGGGPAGVSGAIKAAQMGRRAVIIDKPKFEAGVLPNGLDLFFGGPTGLWSKALREAARNTNVAAMRAQSMDSDVIWKQITNSIVSLSMRNSEGQCRTLERYGIDYIQGSAQLLRDDDALNVAALKKFEDDLDNPEDGIRSVKVSKTTVVNDYVGVVKDTDVLVSGTKVLVCTGSKSTRLRGIPFKESHRIFDSDNINMLGYLPRSVTISGLGIIGIEFANIFNALGVQDVKILVRGDIETSAKKLNMDMDVANELMRLLKKSGVEVLEGTTVDEFTYVPPPGFAEEYIKLKLNDGSTLTTDLFFAATGRYPVGKNEDAGLESAGVEVADKGMVSIDKRTLATSSKNVHAAGDVIGAPALASTSMEQAQRAVAAMFCERGERDVTKDSNHDAPLSIGIWTIPEMGYYGLTKERAEAEGYTAVEGSVGFDRCLRGRVFAPDGLLKIVADATDGTVLGVHIIGKEAAEMVHYGMSLVEGGVSVFEILKTVYTAVTFHELFKEAALEVNSKLDFGVEWQEIFSVLQSTGGECNTEEYIREKFDLIDTDGSGELEEDEMRALFASMGRSVSKRIVANLMRLSDADGNGTIDFEEFKAIFDKISTVVDWGDEETESAAFSILQSTGGEYYTEEYIRGKFDLIDTDGSGELEEDEMRDLFASMGHPVSKRVVANLMRLSDADGNGKIEFEEFKAIFDKISSVVDWGEEEMESADPPKDEEKTENADPSKDEEKMESADARELLAKLS